MKAIQEKNWLLVIFAVLIFLAGLIVVAISLLFLEVFGWWAVPSIASGLTSMYFSYKAVRTNESAWILLDLILPT